MNLPTNTQQLLENYLKPLCPNVPDEMLIVTHYIFISRILCFNRVRLKSKFFFDDPFPNLFGLCFLTSGGGKDLTQAVVEDMYTDIRIAQKGRSDTYRAEREVEIEAVLSEKTTGEDGKEKYKHTPAQRTTLRNHMAPYDIIECLKNSTEEGLQSIREEMQKAGFGSTHFKTSEFADFLSRGNMTKLETLDFVKDLYERGDSEVKFIKSQKEYTPVKGVPCTMLIATALDGIVENKETNALFKEMLQRGIARRSFIVYPDATKSEYKAYTEAEYIQALETSKQYLELAQGMVNEIDEITWTMLSKEGQSTMPLSNDADSLLFKYKQKNEREALYQSKNKEITPSEASEKKDRYRRAARLSASIAAYEHPNKLIITKEDYQMAIDMVEHFAGRLYDLLNLRHNSEAEEMYTFIMREQSADKEISRTTLRNHPKCPRGNGPKKVRWMDSILEEVQEFCEGKGKLLLEERPRKNKKIYKIIDRSEIPTIVTKAELSHPVTLSFSTQDNKTPFKDYKPVECKFSSLAGNLIKGAAYSPAIFRDGYRDTEHLNGHGNLIMIDVDGGMTIDEAKEKLKNYMSLIVTTRSHGIKEGDRFRILIPAETNLTPRYGYSEMMKKILFYLDMKDLVDIGATGDQVRFYYASPEDAMIWYSDSNNLLDWKSFDIERAMAKRPQSTYTPRTDGTLPKNARPDAVFTDKSNKSYSWRDFDTLGQSDTFPVRCIFPEKHANGDKHPSAFVGRHTEGNLMFKCTACQSLVFEK